MGVSGTPAFFINGKMISGAQPEAAFKKIMLLMGPMIIGLTVTQLNTLADFTRAGKEAEPSAV